MYCPSLNKLKNKNQGDDDILALLLLRGFNQLIC
jgi:hypothetical protein